MDLGAGREEAETVSENPTAAGTPRIVGMVFVRNEERFVERAVANMAAFCDEVLLVDRCSDDRTPKILSSLAARAPEKFQFFSIGHPRESHDLLQPYVGQNCWIFAVDGDEIYDAERLAGFRERLLSGEFRGHWMILGNVVHCRGLDPASETAQGYSTPPARSMVKLYNFAALHSWGGDTPERLHGGTPVFREGYHEQLKLELHKEVAWEDSPLRCLHMCFLPRSAADPSDMSSGRESIIETFYGGWTARVRRLWRRLTGQREASESKRERYARGPVVTVSIAPFFPKDDVR